MTNKEANNYVLDIFVDIINCIPKIESMLEVNTLTRVTTDVSLKCDMILKSMVPIDQTAFNLFKDDDIYSEDKIRKTIFKVFESYLEANVSGSTYYTKCLESISAYLTAKLRSDKLNKI